MPHELRGFSKTQSFFARRHWGGSRAWRHEAAGGRAAQRAEAAPEAAAGLAQALACRRSKWPSLAFIEAREADAEPAEPPALLGRDCRVRATMLYLPVAPQQRRICSGRT